jgi:hypothetical protein
MRFRGKFALLATLIMMCPPAMAQNFSLDSIVPGQVVSQAVYNMLPPQLRALVRVGNPQQGNNGLNRRGLPPTTLDSFVWQAGGRAEEIYGDEGVDGLPPIDGFNPQNRINYGIFGSRDAGLTTGHGSIMPAAWGGDEHVHGTEWVRSGANGGNQMPIYVPNPALSVSGVLNSASTSLGIGTERPNVSAPVAIVDRSNITYNPNPPEFMSSYGQWATEAVPYEVTSDMKPVQNNETGRLMGWMSPGESVQQFLSGQTGKLLPTQLMAGQTMLSKLNADQSGYVLPTGAIPAGGF